MKSLDMYQIVITLIGPVYPVGESHRDTERLDNLHELTHLIDDLLTDVQAIADMENRQEASVSKAAKHARNRMDGWGIS